MQADRFTIKAQEAIAAAGQLAERRRNPQVTPEHLLSVLLDAMPTLTAGGAAAGPSSERVRVLREGEEEMRQLKDEYVSTEHLLLALSAHPSRAGDALRAAGVSKVNLDKAIGEVRGPHRVTDQSAEDKYQALEKFARDLTAEAEQVKPSRVMGRDDETRRVIQVLSRRTKNNPVLIGEPGVGKTAIVEGL